MRIPVNNLESVILDFTNFDFPAQDIGLGSGVLFNEYSFSNVMSYWSHPSGFGDPYRVPKVHVIGLKRRQHKDTLYGKWCFLGLDDMPQKWSRLL